MRNKKWRNAVIVFTVVVVSLLASGCSLVKASAADYMRLSEEDRVDYAQRNYLKFSESPDKKFEVLVSFRDVSCQELASLLDGQSNIISAFHCFEVNGECAVGGYTECQGKVAQTVINDYYLSIYNLVVGQIESHDDLVEKIKKSYETGDEAKASDVAMEEELRDEERIYEQFVLQKEAMDNGEFHIYGMRLIMTGAEIEKLLYSDAVVLVEILEFDNNNILTPIR